MFAKSTPVSFPVTQTPIHRPKFYVKFVSLPIPTIKLNIRKDLLISKLMVVSGLVIPALMVCDVIPASFILGFFAIALIAVGGVIFLIRCGEVA